ncbi:hypothetical protein D3C80_1958490 [compost metagenome]
MYDTNCAVEFDPLGNIPRFVLDTRDDGDTSTARIGLGRRDRQLLRVRVFLFEEAHINSIVSPYQRS